MEFTRKGKTFSPRKIKNKITSLAYLNDKYPSDLNMYFDVPTEEICIEDFQEMAVERVKLLRVLEMAYMKAPRATLIKDMVIEEMTKQNLKYFLPIIRGYADSETKKRDYLSHFILRLCYCRSDEMRRWFLSRELEFFRLKFYNLERREDVLLFMKASKLNCKPILDEEKAQLAENLFNSTARHVHLDSVNFYKVPFTKVLDLIRHRRVYLHLGYAYVPQMDLISLFATIFRAHLSSALEICAANVSELEKDERLSRILKGLHTSYTGSDYSQKSKTVTPLNSLDALSVKSFPPCMRAMYERFKTAHHLRHYARLQLGLFLKGIGVSMEDSLKFWRVGFTKNPAIDGDAFEKRYAYSIRHSYGAEGKRADYTPHSCLKIINAGVSVHDNHGCPFKHYDVNSLKKKLLSYNVPLTDVSTIVEYASTGHYQLACTRYFEVTHNVTNAKGINHPNMFFEESQNIIRGKTTETDTKQAKAIQSQDKKPGEHSKAPPLGVEWENDSGFDLNLTDIVNEAEGRSSSKTSLDLNV